MEDEEGRVLAAVDKNFAGLGTIIQTLFTDAHTVRAYSRDKVVHQYTCGCVYLHTDMQIIAYAVVHAYMSLLHRVGTRSVALISAYPHSLHADLTRYIPVVASLTRAHTVQYLVHLDPGSPLYDFGARLAYETPAERQVREGMCNQVDPACA
jgi:hypothetical protein